MADIFDIDDYSPAQIAERVENVGVKKARLPALPLIALGVLAGGFIGLGALYYTVVVSDHELSFALQRVIGGLAFSLGLILVVIAGAELFTGNNLMVMAWVSGRIKTRDLFRNLVLVYFANFVGAFGLALLVLLSHHWKMHGNAVGEQAVLIAASKTALPFIEAFFKAVLCNILVCLAVWLAMGARNVTGKILAIIFPISAFVAAGFEHCIANMYFIPLGILLKATVFPVETGLPDMDTLTWLGFLKNLLPVTLGNFFGGTVLVGLVYFVIYRGPAGERT